MRIFYSIAGEGMGHCTRSLEVIKELSKEHEVRVFASGISYHFLMKHVKDISKIVGFNFVYRKNKVNYLLTALLNLVKLPLAAVYNLKMLFLMLKFRPAVVISDFEPFSSIFSAVLFKPLITIDNQHIINSDIKIKGKSSSLSLLRAMVNIYIPHKTKSFALSFFRPESRNKKLVIVPPIIRKDVRELKSSRGDFILVYQTSRDYDRMVGILSKVDCKFIIPDSGRSETVGNIVFHTDREKSFLSNLAECKAIITNGGFSLMSEALYLGKPVLSEPVQDQLEQYINATYLDSMGFGKFCSRLDSDVVREFCANLENYENHLKKYNQKGNDEFFRELKKALDSLS